MELRGREEFGLLGRGAVCRVETGKEADRRDWDFREEEESGLV